MTFRGAIRSLFTSVARVSPAERFEAIRSGQARLVDVRQPKEWAAGTVEGATLLSLTDLLGSRAHWKPWLETAKEQELVLFCGAGVRSNLAARILAGEGYRVVNGGSFAEWKAAGW